MRKLKIAIAAGTFCIACLGITEASTWNKTTESVAVINVSQVFTSSDFVKKANTELQSNVKAIEKKLQDARNNLQALAKDYEKAKNDSKISATKKQTMLASITKKQTEVNDLIQDSQAKIQTQQNEGMKKFNDLLQIAVASVAKQKKLHTVLNSSSIIYTDNTWIDITKDVEKAMP